MNRSNQVELSFGQRLAEVVGYERIQLITTWGQGNICYNGYKLSEVAEDNKQRLRILTFSTN